MASYRTPVDPFIHMIWKDGDVGTAGVPDIFDGPCTVFSFRFNNNTAGSGAGAAYVKVYDHKQATYANRPIAAFLIPGDEEHTLHCGAGLKFSSGLTIRATVNPMLHSSTDGADPTNNLAVYIVARRD